MKIAIDARGINWYHGTGIGTYTENVLYKLINLDKTNNYQIYWSGDNYSNYLKSNTHIIMSSRRHHKFFEELYFPMNIDKTGVDIYHVPQNGIGLFYPASYKKIVTIHDLIPYIMPETVGKGYLTKFIQDVPGIINNSDAIITVSNQSKKDILKFFPIKENKIFVTPLAANADYKPLNKEKCRIFINEKYNITFPFILYVGGFSPRKNVKALICAFSKIVDKLDKEVKLVIVGSIREEGNPLYALIEELNLSDKVIFTGFVSDKDMPIFYSACSLFAYPSLYEGFGLPPLEAMSCGAPVISSNLSSIPEVVKDGGLLIDPYNENSLSESLGELISNEKLQDYYSKKGYEISKEFSWEKTAMETLEVYKKSL